VRAYVRYVVRVRSQEWEEFSSREDAMEQIKSDKVVMTFLHSRVALPPERRPAFARSCAD
jgi:hypothetical protein